MCVDIFVHMDADVHVGMRKVHVHAQMPIYMCTHAHTCVCAGGRTLNPVDTKLAGAAVPGRILAKQSPLLPLYAESTVLFGMVACWMALVAYA